MLRSAGVFSHTGNDSPNRECEINRPNIGESNTGLIRVRWIGITIAAVQVTDWSFVVSPYHEPRWTTSSIDLRVLLAADPPMVVSAIPLPTVIAPMGV